MHEIIKKIPVRHTLLLAAVTLGLLLLIFKAFHFSLEDVGNINKYWLALAILITLPFPLVSALRWWYILRGMKLEISYKRVLELTLGAWPLTILPGRVGDFVRVVGLPESTPTGLALTSVFLEKVKDVLVLLIFSICGTLALGFPGISLLLIFGVVAILFIVYFLPNINERIKVIRDGINLLLKSKQNLLLAVLASGLNWLLSMIQVYFLFRGVGANIALPVIFAWMPLAIFIGILPVTLEGMGTRDGAILFFFSHYASAAMIITVGLWYTILGYWFLALLGLPWLRSLFVKSRDLVNLF